MTSRRVLIGAGLLLIVGAAVVVVLPRSSENTTPRSVESSPAPSGQTGDGALSVPPTLAGLSLRRVDEGEAARASIDKMHGNKAVAPEDSVIAHYESAGTQAMVWISLFDNEATAGTELERMVASIGEGGAESPFSPPQPTVIDGQEVFASQGLGQTHYMWSEGAKLYWLAADADLAAGTLSEVLAEGDGRGRNGN